MIAKTQNVIFACGKRQASVTVSATAQALWLDGKLSRWLACLSEGPRNLPAFSRFGRTRPKRRLRIMQLTDDASTHDTIAIGALMFFGSNCHARIAASGVATDCPYCARNAV